MFVPTPTQASPAAMELALRITNVIREYQQGRSDVTSRDVRQALRMAEYSTASMASRRIVLVIAAAVCTGVLALALFLAKNPGNAEPPATAFPYIMVAIVAVAIIVTFVLRRR